MEPEVDNPLDIDQKVLHSPETKLDIALEACNPALGGRISDSKELSQKDPLNHQDEDSLSRKVESKCYVLEYLRLILLILLVVMAGFQVIHSLKSNDMHQELTEVKRQLTLLQAQVDALPKELDCQNDDVLDSLKQQEDSFLRPIRDHTPASTYQLNEEIFASR